MTAVQESSIMVPSSENIHFKSGNESNFSPFTVSIPKVHSPIKSGSCFSEVAGLLPHPEKDKKPMHKLPNNFIRRRPKGLGEAFILILLELRA